MTGIVIVTWNSADVIGECLDACLRQRAVRVVVVDNASADGTAAEARKREGVQVIANRTNRGFAAGVNQGTAALRDCAAVLLLNPDAVPLSDLGPLAEAALAPGAGAAAGRLVDPGGRTQSGFNIRRLPTPLALAFEVLGLNRLLPFNPVNRRWRMAGFDPGRPAEVEQPAGAFLMLNRDVWQKTGGFDEGFHPAWFEDTDYCLRLKQEGYRILYVPDVSARHLGGHSASRLTWSDRQLFWYGSLLRYAAKHFDGPGRSLVAAAVLLACVPRVFAGLLSGQGVKSVSVYSRVFRAAVAVLLNTSACRTTSSPSRS